MELVPKDFFEKIEFDKLLELLKKECLGDLGVQKIEKLHIDVRKFIIERKLKEVWEYKSIADNNERFPIGNYTDVAKHLRMLEVVDYVLPEEGLKEISVILRAIQGIFKFFSTSRQLSYPTLYDVIRDETFDEGLIQAIDRVIDEKGQIRPDASPELMAIRKRIHSKQQELEKQFRSIINKFRKNGWLADTVESFRNGRRVLTVPSEHKRKIKGIIHDESTTGKTAFIEPEAIIDINNDIFDLETSEKREIYRILKELSALLRP